jgi:TRAP-type mannitol/chloroaromatic compound transport system permease small subunit
MTTHTLAQTLTNVRQMIGRYAWWLGLSLVLVVAALAAYRSVSAPAASIPEVSSVRAPTSRLDPA